MFLRTELGGGVSVVMAFDVGLSVIRRLSGVLHSRIDIGQVASVVVQYNTVIVER